MTIRKQTLFAFQFSTNSKAWKKLSCRLRCKEDFNNRIIFKFRKKCSLLSVELWVFAYQFAQMRLLLHLACLSSTTSCHLKGDHPIWGIFWPSGANPTVDGGKMMYEICVCPEILKKKHYARKHIKYMNIFVCMGWAVIFCLFFQSEVIHNCPQIQKKRSATCNVLQREYTGTKAIRCHCKRLFPLIKCIQGKPGKELYAFQMRFFFSFLLFLWLLF